MFLTEKYSPDSKTSLHLNQYSLNIQKYLIFEINDKENFLFFYEFFHESPHRVQRFRYHQ
jgi:hypothetical protein